MSDDAEEKPAASTAATSAGTATAASSTKESEDAVEDEDDDKKAADEKTNAERESDQKQRTEARSHHVLDHPVSHRLIKNIVVLDCQHSLYQHSQVLACCLMLLPFSSLLIWFLFICL